MPRIIIQLFLISRLGGSVRNKSWLKILYKTKLVSEDDWCSHGYPTIGSTARSRQSGKFG